MHFVQAKGILSANNGLNLYRGCTHGCIYCDSRSSCYHMAHDFADVEVKENAIELLEQALLRKRRKCMLTTGSMTDPYVPIEEQIGNVHKALLLVYKYGFGITLQTKSSRVLRDIELLQAINEQSKCVVQMTLTTHDEDLCRKLEPNVSGTKERVRTLQLLHAAGIPTVVWLTPILPFINDTPENIQGLLQDCAAAGVYGVICFGMGLTLREGSREYFYRQLDRLFPGLKAKYSQNYGRQYWLESPKNELLMKIFHNTCAQSGLVHNNEQIFTYLYTYEDKRQSVQPSLF